MTTERLFIALFWYVDNSIRHLTKHRQAKRYPSELLTLALLYTLKGGAKRTFYRWICRDYRTLFSHLPEGEHACFGSSSLTKTSLDTSWLIPLSWA